MKGYGSAWCQHLDPFDSLGEDLNEFIGKNGYSVYWADRGRTGRRLMEHLLHHRRLPSPLVYFSWCNGYLQWRHWVGFSSSHPWNLYGSLLWRNSAQPTVKYNVCNGRVYLYPCAILNKSNSHSNEDLVSVPQYARVRLSSPRLWGRVGLLEV